MKKKLLSKKILSGIALVLLCSNVSLGQQVIGEFPSMDGGYESVTATPYQILGTSGTSVWSTSSTSNTFRYIYTDGAIARSGQNYVAFKGNSNGSNRIQSPTVTSITTGATYTVQYYVKTPTNSPFTYLSGAINSTTSANANITATPATYTADTWIKATATFVAPTIGASAYASVRMNQAAQYLESNFALTPTATNIAPANEMIQIDDFVVYAGTEDVTAPDAPSAPTVSDLNVSWTAPVAGVDGGGYVVVRYATNPNADNDPNQNGIYAVGNTITNGTGAKVGTVVFVGTDTSFTDSVAGSVSGSDFYKVYTVDKAFNYSAEVTTLKNNQWSLSNPISVYPNPVKDNQFSISLPDSVSGKVAVGIYNVAGQLVYKTNTTASSKTIAVRPTQSLKAGIYVVKVESNGNSSTQKITVK